MNRFKGKTLSWELKDGVLELALHREPCNEIGSTTLEELEKFVTALEAQESEASSLIIHSELKPGFCAGADLRELYTRSSEMEAADAAKGVRNYLERIHRVMNAIDASPLTTLAAVHGVTFG
ncbi:MAG: enoyl-CoA hydratase/isomerase family protein, partial [Terriglobales bacterium]